MIEKAVEVLRQGGLVAFPTETVYGLGAKAEDERAVGRIFAVKRRPQSHPLIVHLPDKSFLKDWARDIPPAARVVTDAFWPGPLTVVLKRSPRAIDAVTGGQDTIALRVPAHPTARELLRAFAGGIAAPSANRFGCVSPTTAQHVEADLGSEVDLVLDGGPCTIGLESTILDLTGAPRVLRPGAITVQQLEKVLEVRIGLHQTAEIRVPGSAPTHYAPKATVFVVPPTDVQARSAELKRTGRKVAVIATAGTKIEGAIKLFSMPSELAEFARQLYSTLRRVDQEGFDVVVVQQPADTGLGVALNDRLSRASASAST